MLAARQYTVAGDVLLSEARIDEKGAGHDTAANGVEIASNDLLGVGGSTVETGRVLRDLAFSVLDGSVIFQVFVEQDGGEVVNPHVVEKPALDSFEEGAIVSAVGWESVETTLNAALDRTALHGCVEAKDFKKFSDGESGNFFLRILRRRCGWAGHEVLW